MKRGLVDRLMFHPLGVALSISIALVNLGIFVQDTTHWFNLFSFIFLGTVLIWSSDMWLSDTTDKTEEE